MAKVVCKMGERMLENEYKIEKIIASNCVSNMEPK